MPQNRHSRRASWQDFFYNKLVKSNYFDECELITFNPAAES